MSESIDDVIIVPLSVEAMCLTAADVGKVRLAGAYADFSRLIPQEYREKNVAFLPDRTALASDRGVHLQWSLPAPLNSGHVSDSQNRPAAKAGAVPFEGVSFPPAPNRWLVVRLPEKGFLAMEAWIVESDYCSFEPRWQGITVPTDDGHAYVGRCVPLRKWVPRDEQASTGHLLDWKLTAVGWGDPLFSAYYPSCRNVFGFHDPLLGADGRTEERPGRLNYLVAGWHSRPEDDILFDPEKLHEALAWALSKSEGGALATMRRSIFSGLVEGVSWSSVDVGFPCAAESKVAVGNNIQESLSALLACEGNRAKAAAAGRFEKERVLNTLFSGLEKSLPAVDNEASHIDDELHMLRFLSSDGGNNWTVRPKQTGAAKSDMESEELLPEAVEVPLAEYNAAQRELDYATRLWLAHRRRIRDDLSLLEQMIADPKSHDTNAGHWSDIRVRLRRRLEADLAEIYRIDLRSLESRAASARGEVESALLAVRTKEREFELTALPAPRFWKPRDPVVLFQDDDLRAAPRYGSKFSLPMLADEGFSDAPDSFLRCRTAKNIVAAFPVDGLKAFPQQFLPYSRIFGSLVAQAGARPDGNSGPLPASAKSWRPVYLRWNAIYTPEASPSAGNGRYSEDALSEHWKFPTAPADAAAADQAELLPVSSVPPQAPPTIKLTGIAMMETSASPEFLRRLGIRLKTMGDSTRLSREVATISGDHLASATLDGFHDRLLMYESGFNLPLQDRARLLHLFEIPPWLQDGHEGDDLRPNVRQAVFSPLRSGTFEITSLELIDTFGRVKKIHAKSDHVLLSSSMTPPHGTASSAGTVFLPPRLCTPARLAFRLKSSRRVEKDEGSSPANSSFVAGWMIPSHVESGVVLCASDGGMAGMLRYHGEKPVFLPAPGRGIGDLDGCIRQFADALLSGELSLRKLIDTLEKETLQIVPEQKHHMPGMGELMGRPFAVVTAELGIDLQGDLPPRRHTLGFPGGAAPDDCGLLDVRIPVQLGDPDRRNDGLAAFFLAEPDAARGDREFDFKEMWTPAGSVSAPARLHPLLRLAGYGRDRRLRLLMLVDPRAPIHATAGLFPVKPITIPSAHYKAARKKLGVLFPCGPLLLPDPKDWSLPLQPVENQKWFWADSTTSKNNEDPWRPVAATPPLPVQSDLPSITEIKGRIWLTLRPDPTSPNPP